MEGFCVTSLRGLIFGGAYTWRGFFSKFYGIFQFQCNAQQGPTLVQDPHMMNRVSMMMTMMMMMIMTENMVDIHHHRLQLQLGTSNHKLLGPHHHHQDLTWVGDVEEGGVFNPVSLFGDQIFLAWQEVLLLLLLPVKVRQQQACLVTIEVVDASPVPA